MTKLSLGFWQTLTIIKFKLINSNLPYVKRSGKERDTRTSRGDQLP